MAETVEGCVLDTRIGTYANPSCIPNSKLAYWLRRWDGFNDRQQAYHVAKLESDIRILKIAIYHSKANHDGRAVDRLDRLTKLFDLKQAELGLIRSEDCDF